MSMDRRSFLRVGAVSLVLGKLGIGEAAAKNRKSGPFGPVTCEGAAASEGDLALRFLGTGAAGWKEGDSHFRRQSSVLLDGKVLIDFTKSAPAMMPEGCRPEVVFFTHSHGDHFGPEPTLQAGVKRAYVSETWVERAREKFAAAAGKTGLPEPEVIPLKVGQKVEEGGLVFTALPANHATGDLGEQSLIYLVEKGTADEKLGVRLLYATDTGGILGTAARLAGIDSHLNPGRPITALIMEATMPMDMDEDFRIFNHSSALEVSRTANMLTATRRYLPPTGQPVYITHMMSSGPYPPHDKLNRELPSPLRAAADGLDIVLKAQ